VDKFAAMQLLVRVADTGSFSKAARGAGIAQSTVSKQIASLEARLGAQLLRRTTRGLSLTEAGKDYYDQVMQLLNGIEDVEAKIARGQVAPSGVLRVALSPGFGRFYVIPHMPEFLRLYPDVSVDFEVSDRHSNLIEEELDLAIRIGPLSDSSLIAKRIGGVRYVTVGTPEYFERHGVPKSPRDVERMPCAVFMFEGAAYSWRFEDRSGPFALNPKAIFRSNDAEYLRQAVLSHLGMGHSPRWLYERDLASGRLIEVLEDFIPPPCPISALSPAGRRQTRKAQVFTDFLAGKFSAIPELSLKG
jgi:LysR family transcriptional regulator, regulator for bpeEF and oprC